MPEKSQIPAPISGQAPLKKTADDDETSYNLYLGEHGEKFIQSFKTLDEAKAQVREWVLDLGQLGADDILIWYPEKPTTYWSSKGQIRGRGGARVSGTDVWHITGPRAKFSFYGLGYDFPNLLPYVEIPEEVWAAEVVPELSKILGRLRVLGKSSDSKDVLENLVEELRVSSFPWAHEVIRGLREYLEGTTRQIVEKKSAAVPLRKTAGKFTEQTFSDDTGAWAVPDLLAAAQSRRPKKLSVAELAAQNLGDDDSRADEPVGSPEFIARAEVADLRFPILVVKYANGKLLIADGLHRLWKAQKLGRELISAYVLDQSSLAKIPQIAKTAGAPEKEPINIFSTNPEELVPEEIMQRPETWRWAVRTWDAAANKTYSETFPDHIGAFGRAKDLMAPGIKVVVEFSAMIEPDLERLRKNIWDEYEKPLQGVYMEWSGTFAEARWWSVDENPFQVVWLHYGYFRPHFQVDSQSEPGPTEEYLRYVGKDREVVRDDEWFRELPKTQNLDPVPTKTAALAQTQNLIDELILVRDLIKEPLRPAWDEKVGPALAKWGKIIRDVAELHQHSAWKASVRGKAFLVSLPERHTQHDLIQKVLSLPALQEAAGFKDGNLQDLHLHQLRTQKSGRGVRLYDPVSKSLDVLFEPVNVGEAVFDEGLLMVGDPRTDLSLAGFKKKLGEFVNDGIKAKDWVLIWDLGAALYDLAVELSGPNPNKPDPEAFNNYFRARDIGPADAVPLNGPDQIKTAANPIRIGYGPAEEISRHFLDTAQYDRRGLIRKFSSEKLPIEVVVPILGKHQTFVQVGLAPPAQDTGGRYEHGQISILFGDIQCLLDHGWLEPEELKSGNFIIDKEAVFADRLKTLTSSIMHELTHAADPWSHGGQESENMKRWTRKQDFEKFTKEDWKSYLEAPEEFRAQLQEAVYEASKELDRHLDLNETLGEDLPLTFKQLIERVETVHEMRTAVRKFDVEQKLLNQIYQAIYTMMIGRDIDPRTGKKITAAAAEIPLQKNSGSLIPIGTETSWYADAWDGSNNHSRFEGTRSEVWSWAKKRVSPSNSVSVFAVSKDESESMSAHAQEVLDAGNWPSSGQLELPAGIETRLMWKSRNGKPFGPPQIMVLERTDIFVLDSKGRPSWVDTETKTTHEGDLAPSMQGDSLPSQRGN